MLPFPIVYYSLQLLKDFPIELHWFNRIAARRPLRALSSEVTSANSFNVIALGTLCSVMKFTYSSVITCCFLPLLGAGCLDK